MTLGDMERQGRQRFFWPARMCSKKSDRWSAVSLVLNHAYHDVPVEIELLCSFITPVITRKSHHTLLIHSCICVVGRQTRTFGQHRAAMLTFKRKRNATNVSLQHYGMVKCPLGHKCTERQIRDGHHQRPALPVTQNRQIWYAEQVYYKL